MATGQTGAGLSGGLFASVLFLIVLAAVVYSEPFGATITYIANTTKGATNGSIANYTGGGTSSGGYIFYTNISGTQQNLRWKGFVGNVSGKLTLDDASGNTLYDWSIVGSPTGEVYATRTGGTVNWSAIKCAYPNATYSENFRLNHTSPTDNITATFSASTNKQFNVGTVTISANTCNTTNLYVNDTINGLDTFEEVLLYDGPSLLLTNETYNMSNVIYTALIEQDVSSFDAKTYDFQMILPEVGLSTWTSSTAYYFFIELT
ncbi:hypothetical protein HY640_00440 [Candidatus Woesearchaeota archaeon]|nr:hypothetical protein [Candidatus Woesearchaeota archaeon]